MQKMYQYWEVALAQIVEGVGMIDFLVSGAKVAKDNNYCEPKILECSVQHPHSSVEVVKMRHPLIEKLTESTYVPHDLKLNATGMLLYGSNGSGKSSLSKSLGMNLVLAQCGLYVPCKSMVLYPYRYLFARITGNDNLLRGLSSFAVEMLELKAILRHAGPNSLFVGDELCRGTRADCGAAIVTAAVENLAQSQSSFIFATHLHEIANFPEIQQLKNVEVCHIGSSYDPQKGVIVYERDLRPGCDDSLYGLHVACNFLGNKQFMQRADYFIKKLGSASGDLVEKRKSKYNNNIYLTECSICKSKQDLNVHHIKHQAHCVNNYAEHIRKDSKGNLVVVCRNCHMQVHSDNIVIDGWIETSEGRTLKYSRNNKPQLEAEILELRDEYTVSDWTKDWACSDAVKKLGKLGYRTTAKYVYRLWNQYPTQLSKIKASTKQSS
jgi:DNA mismatch repair protein MutS